MAWGKKKNTESEDFYRRQMEAKQKTDIINPGIEAIKNAKFNIDPKLLEIIKAEIDKSLSFVKTGTNINLEPIINLVNVMEDNLNELKAYLAKLRD